VTKDLLKSKLLSPTPQGNKKLLYVKGIARRKSVAPKGIGLKLNLFRKGGKINST